MKKFFKINFLFLFLLIINIFIALPVCAMDISVYVPDKFRNVYAGERFYFEVDINYPENYTKKDLKLTYEIKKDENIISETRLLMPVENHITFLDYVIIPKTAEEGLHMINILVPDYYDFKEEVFTSFYVIGSFVEQIRLYFFIILGTIIFVGLLVGIDIFIAKRENRNPEYL